MPYELCWLGQRFSHKCLLLKRKISIYLKASVLRTTAKCLPKDQQPRDLQTWSEILGMLPQATIFSALNSNADCISMPILKKNKGRYFRHKKLQNKSFWSTSQNSYSNDVLKCTDHYYFRFINPSTCTMKEKKKVNA